MEYTSEKEVYFDQYCPSCIHKDTAEEQEPCCTCLAYPSNEYSHRPIKWEGKT